ncbi:YjbF family lipoprotein [Ruegeria arenilitoris]|uniref:YjbF family lipoprotein n=1 Tax=Ruegeria arenilitoris TaxID=1173585 RepID=UPI00147FBADA|nr:YjbF family lipoprotein [Ruegeria arenilitoris]
MVRIIVVVLVLADCTPDGDGPRSVLMPAMLNRQGQPTMLAELPKLSVSATMALFDGNGDVQTWKLADGVSMSFLDGVLVSSRGLGADVMSADVSGTRAMPAGDLATLDRELGTIRSYRSGDLYQTPLRDYLARPEFRQLVLLNGDAVFADTSHELDRALAFYRDQIVVISRNRQAKGAALAELEQEVGLRRAKLTETRDNFTVRSQLGAKQRDYVYLGGEFRKNARVSLPYGQHLSLADALFGEGGYSTRTADASRIYVLRASPKPEGFGAVTAWHLDARDPSALSIAARMELRPYDIVLIQEQPITTWGRALDQFLPSLVNAGLDAANG